MQKKLCALAGKGPWVAMDEVNKKRNEIMRKNRKKYKTKLCALAGKGPGLPMDEVYR